MQENALRHMRQEFLPNAVYKIFYGTDFALHEWHIQIQIPVIQDIHHLIFDDPAEQFGIDNEACLRIWLPLHRDEQFKIMAMPILIGTFAKNLFIPLFCP